MTETRAPYQAGPKTPDTFQPVCHPDTGRTIARYDPKRHVLRVWDRGREAEVPLPKQEPG